MFIPSLAPALVLLLLAPAAFSKGGVPGLTVLSAEERVRAARIQGAALDEEYAQKFPLYAEYCGLSKISKKKINFGLDVQGGKGGHGLLYLHGACRKESARYPEIALCQDLSESDRAAYSGVGISVNSDFKNANWIAVPGKDFFFYGNLSPEQELSKEAYLQVRAEAQRRDILRGVEFHPELFAKNPQLSPTEYMWEDTFGTDYAFALARETYCVKVPLAEAEMKQAIQYLNNENEKYRYGKADYKWSGIYNNCTHTAHNALAAAGIWAPYKTDVSLPIQLFNLAIPLNEFATLMARGNDGPISDVWQTYRDSELRKNVLERKSLPARPGTIARYIPVHEPNEVFATVKDALLLEIKGLRTVGRKIDRYLLEPRYTVLGANLSYHQNQIQRARTQPYPSMRGEELEPIDFPAFYADWQALILAQP